MATEIRFFVAGIPRPGGSKRVFPIRKAGVLTGKFVVTDAAGQANKDWRASVAHEGKEATNGHGPWTCPIELELAFTMPRPKSHIMVGKIFGPVNERLKATAPKHHTSRPDTGKLARSTQDALTGIIWQDDAQIVKETHSKAYGSRPGVMVTVREARSL